MLVDDIYYWVWEEVCKWGWYVCDTCFLLGTILISLSRRVTDNIDNNDQSMLFLTLHFTQSAPIIQWFLSLLSHMCHTYLSQVCPYLQLPSFARSEQILSMHWCCESTGQSGCNIGAGFVNNIYDDVPSSQYPVSTDLVPLHCPNPIYLLPYLIYILNPSVLSWTEV